MEQLSSAIKKTIIAFEKRKNHEQKISISTEQMKQLFYSEAKKYYRKRYRQFLVDDNNKNYLNLLCKYFAEDKTFETIHKGELHKGIYAFGNHGTGKTSSLEIIQEISKKYALKNLWFPIVRARKVVERFNTEKNKDYIVRYYSRGCFCFDDLGAEDIASNVFVFGKQDIFIRIMEARYDEFVSKGTKTHITTNLTIQDIKKRYGARVEDRFVEMFNFLEIQGNSKR